MACVFWDTQGVVLVDFVPRGHTWLLQTRLLPRCDKSGKNQTRTSCKHCGRQHDVRKEACPAYGQTCRRCQKCNQIKSKSNQITLLATAPLIRSSGVQVQAYDYNANTITIITLNLCQVKTGSSKKSSSGQQSVNELDTDEELLVLDDADADRWHTQLKIDNRTVCFLLDCGATVNLLPESFVHSIGRMNEVRASTNTLRMFDRSQLQTRGIIGLSVQHPHTLQYYDLEFYVVAKHDKPLLGFHACRALKLLRVVEENVCQVQASNSAYPSPTKCITEADILAEYADLFDGVGLLEGDIHLETDPTILPMQMPLCRIPIGLRDKVAAELQRLEADGIITPVTEPSLWVSALLAVAKPDNRIRICIDPKPLKKALKWAHYRMPVINDILPQLAGAKVFSTVDVKEVFRSLQLDEEFSHLTTFEMPFGRYR